LGPRAAFKPNFTNIPSIAGDVHQRLDGKAGQIRYPTAPAVDFAGRIELAQTATFESSTLNETILQRL
jgi:hypothetical protein